MFQRVSSGVKKSLVRGIGFDATCSLVVLDHTFQPVSVNHNGNCILFIYTILICS